MEAVILIGFMGSGKTAVGRWLARKLGWTLYDIDKTIERKSGCRIRTIFKRHGEKRFRQLETRALKVLAGKLGGRRKMAGSVGSTGRKGRRYKIGVARGAGLVVATGGGIVLRPANRRIMRRLGLVVLLTAWPEVIIKRVAGQTGRPLLDVPNKYATIKRILAARKAFYEKTAHLKIDTSRLTVRQVGQKIINDLNKHG